MKELNRCTSATRKRADNMKSLIENLRAVGRMGRDDFGLFLGMSPSGGRKYLRELAEDEMIHIVGFEEIMKNGQPGAPTFALNKDVALVDAYLLKLETAPQNLTERRARVDHTSTGPRMQKVQAEDGRQVHMLRDDVEHKPRSARFKIPAHEPVLAAFFGFAGA
jgi:hypothetical protein